MTKTPHKTGLVAGMIMLLTLSMGVSAEPYSGPSWRELDFEAKSMWATALTGLYLSTLDSSEYGKAWELLLLGSVASNSERETIVMTPGSGALLQRDRFTSGKSQRLKQYAYDEHTVIRVRREPGASTDQAPSQWAISSQKKLDRPSLEECPVLTSIPSLLIFASNIAAAPEQPVITCVHSDNNFYKVTMTVTGEKKIKVDYKLAGTAKQITGKKTAIAIGLDIQRVGKPEGDTDFSLLGLSGTVVIFVDKDSRLPLQVRGQAPRVGKAKINLIGATTANED